MADVRERSTVATGVSRFVNDPAQPGQIRRAPQWRGGGAVHTVAMSGWGVTALVADGAVRTGKWPRLRTLSDALIRGALLLDLALARLVVADGAALHAAAQKSGFPPADRLLDASATAASAELRSLIRRGPCGMHQVIEEFVALGWWTQDPTSWWLRRRYMPTDLISAGAGTPVTGHLARTMLMLFNESLDTEDLEDQVAAGPCGPAAWLVDPVLHELSDLRAWLRAVVATNPQSG